MDTIRVLVIESSSFYRDTLFGGLRSRIDDVQLESATDADEAVLKIRIFNPNVIVLNFFMIFSFLRFLFRETSSDEGGGLKKR